MKKILKVHINDILADEKEASQMVNQACHHQTPMRIVGCCFSMPNIILVLEEIQETVDLKYRFARFPDGSEDGIVAEVNARYYAGFTTITSFEIADHTWGLFAKNKEPLLV